VKRLAATGLGFVLCKLSLLPKMTCIQKILSDPEQCLNVLRPLFVNASPHIRCGATVGLGIACAGSGNPDALKALEPILKDQDLFVRQGCPAM
jgi:hypothetical protein